MASDNKVAVYIDGSNRYHSMRDFAHRSDVNFAKFVAKLVGDRSLVRTYYYNAPADQTKEPEKYRTQQRFFQALKNVNYL